MTTVNQLRGTSGDNYNNLIVNLNAGNSYSFSNVLIPSIRNKKIVRVLSSTECLVSINFLRDNLYAYNNTTPNADLGFSKAIWVGHKHMYYQCIENIQDIKVSLYQINGSSQNNLVNDEQVQMVFEFLEDLQPSLCVRNQIHGGRRERLYNVFLNQANGFVWSQKLTPPIQGFKCVRFLSNYNDYVNVNFIRTSQYRFDATIPEPYLTFSKQVWVGEKNQYYLVDNTISEVVMSTVDQTGDVRMEITCEFFDYIPEIMAEDIDPRFVISGSNEDSSLESLVLYVDSSNWNQGLDLWQTILNLQQQYKKIDCYVMYKEFKVFLSIFPQFILKYFLPFFSKPCLTIRFVSNNWLRKPQFYNQTSNQIPNVDVYFLPLNWVTTDITYSDNAGLSRAANDSFYRVFSVGYTVVTFCRGPGQPNLFGNPHAAHLAVAGVPLPYKTTPNGQPISTSQTFTLVYPQVFRNLIVYPLPPPTSPNHMTTFQITNNYMDPATMIDNRIRVSGAMVNVTDLDQMQFFQVDSFFQTQSDNPGPLRTIQLDINPAGGGPAYIDTVLLTTTPIIGNNVLVDPGANFGLEFHTGSELIQGDLDAFGNIIPSTTSWLIIINFDVAQMEGLVFAFTNINPDRNGIWLSSCTAQQCTPAFAGTFPYTGLATSFAKYALIWDTGTTPAFDIGGNNAFLALTKSPFIYYIGVLPTNNTAVPFIKQFQRVLKNFNDPATLNNTVPIAKSDGFNYTVFSGHDFSTIRSALGITFQTIFTAPTYNTTYVFGTPSPRNNFTSFPIFMDDTPLSQTVKFLPEGFQFRNYYQITHLVKNTMILYNLVWTVTSEEGVPNLTSNTISLPQVMFSKLKMLTGQIAYNTSVNYAGTLEAVTLKAKGLTKGNDYNQTLPLFLANDGEYEFISQEVDSLTNIQFIVNNTNGSTDFYIILYFLS